MVVDTSDKNQIFLFLSHEPISKVDPVWLDRAQRWRSLTAYISDRVIDKEVKFWDNIEPSFKFYLIKYAIDNFLWFENYAFFDIVEISSIFGSYFIITFWWNGKFLNLMVSLEISSLSLLESILSPSCHRIYFYVKKTCIFFFFQVYFSNYS